MSFSSALGASRRLLCPPFSKRSLVGWLIIALALTIVAGVLTSPRFFGIWTEAPLTQITSGGGYAAKAPLPPEVKPPRGNSFLFPDPALIFENSEVLRRELATERSIRSGGWGRYTLSGRKVIFSSSDGSNPWENGRTYSIRTSGLRVSEALLLGIWGGAIAAWWLFLRLAAQSATWMRWQSQSDTLRLIAAAVLGVILAGKFLWSVPGFGDSFMLEWFVPLIWSLATACAIGSRKSLGIWLAFSLGAVPAIALWVYYTLSASSHGWFLLGGVIPWSDANVHFQQAADMAQSGFTQEPFNGRFLFPAFFGFLLWLCSYHLQSATLVVALFTLGSLIIAARAMAPRIRVAGVTIFLWISWLYFRECGGGLVMTESLGLTFGALGLACFFLFGRSNRISFLLLGIFLWAVGFSIRPGALFALPALCLYAGYHYWKCCSDSPLIKRGAQAALIVVAAIVIVGAGFSLNSVAMKTLFVGKITPFSNFAYSLHGLLTDSNWKKAEVDFQNNPQAAMAESLRLLKTEPIRLVKGIGRAYQELFLEGFFYRFGKERWAAKVLMLLAAIGIGALWYRRDLRPDAGWITLAGLGVLASVPFVPPWDAGLRPYAVTIPLQALLPALGAAVLASGFCRPWKTHTSESEPVFSSTVTLAAVVILLLFTLPLPLARAWFARNQPAAPTVAVLPPQILPGSFVKINQSPEFRERLSVFLLNTPSPAYEALKPEDIVGINWNNRSLYLGPKPSE